MILLLSPESLLPVPCQQQNHQEYLLLSHLTLILAWSSTEFLKQPQRNPYYCLSHSSNRQCPDDTPATAQRSKDVLSCQKMLLMGWRIRRALLFQNSYFLPFECPQLYSSVWLCPLKVCPSEGALKDYVLPQVSQHKNPPICFQLSLQHFFFLPRFVPSLVCSSWRVSLEMIQELHLENLGQNLSLAYQLTVFSKSCKLSKPQFPPKWMKSYTT